MASQRAKNKVQIGAYIDIATDGGIQAWLDGNPRKTKTDFLFEAIVEKLLREKIPLPPEAGSRQRPMRHSRSKKATPASLDPSPQANSASDLGAEIFEHALSSAEQRAAAKKAPSGKVRPKAKAAPPPEVRPISFGRVPRPLDL